jgi:NitT/TauT family transport system substrate-binding protein
MRLKPAGKLALAVVLIAVIIGVYKVIPAKNKPDIPILGGKTGSASGKSAADGGDQGILGRPLKVGLVTWPGYLGGIVANNGFKPNRDCLFWNGHKLLVELMLLEDIDLRGKMFAKGGPEGVDIVWSTVDFWANELPGLSKNGVKARAIMQVDWSRGGDAIVAGPGISRVEDLRGKKIALVQFTPSHWLLEYSLQNSSLSAQDVNAIVHNLVSSGSTTDARNAFIAGQVDACVVWEPDVTAALKRRGSRILVSSATATNLIADVMCAKESFIQEHPEVVQAFVAGWLDGAVEANRDPSKAVGLLVENEPLYKDAGDAVARDHLTKVKLADLSDNTRMFGLDGSTPMYNTLFKTASDTWQKRGYIQYAMAPAQSIETRFLKEVYKEHPVTPPKQEIVLKKPTPTQETKAPVMTKRVAIHFPSGSATLATGSKQALDQVAALLQAMGNAYVRVEGNTDNVGSTATNVALSRQRAESAVSYLINKHGFDRNRFVVRGNGPNKPVASNSSEDGRQKNRRTDVEIIPA